MTPPKPEGPWTKWNKRSINQAQEQKNKKQQQKQQQQQQQQQKDPAKLQIPRFFWQNLPRIHHRLFLPCDPSAHQTPR